MDDEVFLVSRIREYGLASGQTHADSDEAVALGIARTGRVVTAAAVVMSISFAALIAAEVSFMRMFGLGLTLAVLADATLVRMVLMPAFMHVMGGWNWWAPKWLSRIHDRFGLDHGGGVRPKRTNDIAGATTVVRSEPQGPLNEEVAGVVSTMRRFS
jgi:putative drug exporter of the RND superfamily